MDDRAARCAAILAPSMPSEKPDKPSESAPEVAPEAALVLARQLAEEDEAQLVGQGSFSLDLAQARDKLAHKRLADPGMLILMLVEVGNLLKGCTAIDLRSAPNELAASFVGVRMREAELRAGLELELGGLDGLEPAARADALGRRTLAVAIDAALALPWTRHVDIVSLTHEGPVASLRMRSGQPPLPNPEAGVLHSEGLSVSIQRQRNAGLRHRMRERELIERARYSTIPLTLDGRRIDTPTPLIDLHASREIRSPAGAKLGTIGWSPARAKASLQLLANGVVLESLPQHGWPAGGTAVVEASDLRRDLSLTKFVRDEAFEARIALVQDHASAITPAHDTGLVYAPEASSLLPGDNSRLLMIYAAIALPVMALVLGINPYGLVVGIVLAIAGAPVTLSVSDVLRMIMMQSRGLPGIATVEALTKEESKDRYLVEVEVEMPDRKPYRGIVRARLTDTDQGQVRPGVRVAIRVDPEDEQRIVFASSRHA